MKDVLDADRPFLEQFEEQALVDDQACEWLLEEIYPNPERMSVLTNTVLEPTPVVPGQRSKGSPCATRGPTPRARGGGQRERDP